MSNRLYQVLASYLSPSGNPQRLTMVYDATGEVLAALDHGYQGDRIPRDGVRLPSVFIPRREYHDKLRAYREVTRAYEEQSK